MSALYTAFLRHINDMGEDVAFHGAGSKEQFVAELETMQSMWQALKDGKIDDVAAYKYKGGYESFIDTFSESPELEPEHMLDWLRDCALTYWETHPDKMTFEFEPEDDEDDEDDEDCTE